jgi:hypothetical protein
MKNMQTSQYQTFTNSANGGNSNILAYLRIGIQLFQYLQMIFARFRIT